MTRSKEKKHPKVMVLLSTYNGAKYIREQLNSLFYQEEVDIACLIRDDGSSDNTVEIVSDYCNEHNGFSFIKGENIGVVRSFGVLLGQSLIYDYDWIAFCDQDDVWDKDKLKVAISKLSNYPKDIPLLYCSNLRLVDKSLNYLKMMRNKKPKGNEYSSCFQNCATGCTQVFNKRALELYNNGIESRIEMHDYWMYLICLCLGKVIYDEEGYINYRQHSNNVVGAKKVTARIYIKNLITTKQGYRYDMIEDFVKAYSDLLSEKQVQIYNGFLKSRTSILSRLRVFVSLWYVGYDFKTTMGLKIRVLLGRMC